MSVRLGNSRLCDGTQIFIGPSIITISFIIFLLTLQIGFVWYIPIILYFTSFLLLMSLWIWTGCADLSDIIKIIKYRKSLKEIYEDELRKP